MRILLPSRPLSPSLSLSQTPWTTPKQEVNFLFSLKKSELLGFGCFAVTASYQVLCSRLNCKCLSTMSLKIL